MNTWLVMAIAGLGTYLLRVALVVAHGRLGTPRWLESQLRLIAPSVLAAILTASLFVRHEPGSAPAAELIAVGAAYLAVRRTGNVSAALVTGLPVYWVCLAVGVAA